VSDWFADYRTTLNLPIEHTDFTNDILARSTTHAKPWFLNIAGVPGSGKSTMLGLLKNHPDIAAFNPAIVVLDRMMENEPAYLKALQERGSEAAYAEREMIVRATGFDLMRQLTEKRACFIFEYSGADDTFHGFLDTLKNKHGYKTARIELVADAETCTARVMERTQKTGHHVPLDFIARRIAILNEKRAAYQVIVSHYAMVDNSADVPLNTNWVTDFISAVR
jgi:predicted ABC-type ATPase